MGPLDLARVNGYLELDFPRVSNDSDSRICELLAIANEWALECARNSRHGIVVGHRDDGHFLVWSRKAAREHHYVMLAIWAAFRTIAEQPTWNCERASIWAPATRELAVRAAKKLVEIDRTPRDPSLEIGVGTELISAPTVIEA